MSDSSKSPERHTFQLAAAKKRAAEDGTEIPEYYENFWKTAKEQDAANLVDPTWQKDNLEYDLRSTAWILEKARASDAYAQNIYAALCNNDFIKREMWPILKDQRWSCTWRYAGGIVADMIEKGDYIDWYMSGMGGIADYDTDPKEWAAETGYVPEGTITQEIEDDLFKLGWLIIKEN